MEHALAMGITQRLAHRAHDVHHLGNSQTAGLQASFERFAFDKAHDQVRLPVMLAKVIDGDDMRMLQLGDDAGFALKASEKGRVSFEGLVHYFDSDIAVEGGVVSFLDRRHPAAAQLRDDAIRSNNFSIGKAHERLLCLAEHQ